VMERRNFLKILPIAAVSPKVIREGVVSFELPKGGHYVVVVNPQLVDVNELMDTPGILPEGATGGWIVKCFGDPEQGIKFYRMEEDGGLRRKDAETEMS
jgi:hypothetical protein